MEKISLEKQALLLNKEVYERKKIEKEQLLHQNNLEELVNEKTKELQIKNLKLDYLSKPDPLTALPNRGAFVAEIRKTLAMSRKHNRKFALVMIAVNNFKYINDIDGHNFGDLVLKDVSMKLQRSIREEDHVARLGGNEFAIILTELNEDSNAVIVVNKLLSYCQSNPLILNDIRIDISLSLGISCYPSCGKTIETLLKQADIAMCKAKDTGLNTYRFFMKEMDAYVERRTIVKKELQQKNKLSLHYQPIVNMKENKIVGVEALLKWNGPILGEIGTEEFISIAEEESTLIQEIGLWVIEEVCRITEKPKKRGLVLAFFQSTLISINRYS